MRSSASARFGRTIRYSIGAGDRPRVRAVLDTGLRGDDSFGNVAIAPKFPPIRFSNAACLQTQLHDLAAQCARSFAIDFLGPPFRGRREDRVRAAPAVSCATRALKNAHEHTGSAETLRPSLRNGFTAYSALSPVIELSCHRHPREGLLPANLTPASGRQDHTASPYAAGPPVLCAAASTAAHPHVRDVRETPLRVERDAINID